MPIRRLIARGRSTALALAAVPLIHTAAAAQEPLPEIVAHRGASHLAPENTLAAIQLAWQLGADAVECDIRLSRDGQVVLLHDATTRRTAGRDRPIVEQDAVELDQLDAGSWKDARFAGERIPLLGDVLKTVPEGRRLFIEVKTGPEIIDPLLALLDRSDLKPEQACVISFNWEVVRAIKQQRPAMKAYWLSSFTRDEDTGQWTPSIDRVIARAKDAGADGVNLRAREPILHAEAVEQIAAAGLELYTWTVDDPDLARRLWQLGVHGITTNRPGQLRAELAGPAQREGDASGGRSQAGAE